MELITSLARSAPAILAATFAMSVAVALMPASTPSMAIGGVATLEVAPDVADAFQAGYDSHNSRAWVKTSAGEVIAMGKGKIAKTVASKLSKFTPKFIRDRIEAFAGQIVGYAKHVQGQRRTGIWGELGNTSRNGWGIDLGLF